MAAKTSTPAQDEGTPPESKKRGSWRILPKSLAGKASCLSTLLLVALVISVWVLFFLDPNNVPWRHSMGWRRIVGEIALVIVIPVFVYYTVRYWSEAERSRFFDIDYAWKAGLEALDEHGVSLRDSPVFLVLGLQGEERASALLDAAKLDLRVAGAPTGAAPLYWFAASDAIYLVCSEAGWLSAQSTRMTGRSGRARPPVQAAAARAASPRPATTAAVSSPAPAAPPAPGSGTLQVGPPSASAPPAASAAPRSPSASGKGAPAPAAEGARGGAYGTLVLDQFISRQEPSRESVPRGPAPEGPPSRSAVAPAPTPSAVVQDWDTMVPESPLEEEIGPRSSRLTSEESSLQLERLEYVCELLRHARHPVCPANGLLVVFPFDLFQCGDREAADLTAAIKGDLQVVQRGMRARLPVTAVVTGMERERGFQEVVRRVGRDRALHQRFGQRFDVRSVATMEVLQAFVAHVTGTFEDWVYALFREEDSLTRPGNTHLYGLLSKVRCTFKPRLASILIGAFAQDAPGARETGHFFSGCYFSATGTSGDRQAFVRGVVQKLLDEQDDVEWTQSAMSENRRIGWITASGWLISAALAAALLYRLGENFLQR